VWEIFISDVRVGFEVKNHMVTTIHCSYFELGLVRCGRHNWHCICWLRFNLSRFSITKVAASDATKTQGAPSICRTTQHFY